MLPGDTPLMQQWREVKARHRDAIVLFRVGDFYEMFNEDAEEGARLLDLTLTSRNNGSSRAPLAGVPAHALDTYLQRLVKLGRRVAICEQVEDPSKAKGIVRREVVETVTPGAVLADPLLESRRNNFLVALAGDPARDRPLGMASADLSTGDLLLESVAWDEIADALSRAEPSEVLLPRSWEVYSVELPRALTVTTRGDAVFDPGNAAEEIKQHFGLLNLDGFGILPEEEHLTSACGALLAYLGEVQPVRAPTMRAPRISRGGDRMILDEMTCRNLELTAPLRGGEAGGTLLEVLDTASTPMGSRLLRRWLLAPLVDRRRIERRLAAVAELVAASDSRVALRAALEEIGDLERLAMRVATQRVSPRGLLALRDALNQIPILHEVLADSGALLLQEHRDALDPSDQVRDLISAAIAPEAPAALGDGGAIRAGYSAELDRLCEARDGGVEWIARLQARERTRTGIASLKVGFNKVFGYYIEVTRANLGRVPDDYDRKQTLANAERYVTPELKEWEERVLTAEEKIGELESSLFAGVCERLAAEVPRVQRMAERLAALDVIATLADVALEREFVRPEIHHGFGLAIEGGRHPVVEAMMPREAFIPNDVRLEEDSRVVILTGPNMAGKSTVLRQVGLIVLLAHLGSFVPARTARIALVDRIFTRVGASDNLVRGQSTFMVEMNETASILHSATDRSLVLLDEIGRGTATWDGLSVATAVTEWLHQRIGAKTIFATHYHELTQLAERLSSVVNFSVAVREEEGQILFLRRLVPGRADRSYGVEVARMAGLPVEVVERAREVLRTLENDRPPEASRAPVSAAPEAQLTFFIPQPHEALIRLREVDVHQTTPLQALNLLAELAELVRD